MWLNTTAAPATVIMDNWYKYHLTFLENVREGYHSDEVKARISFIIILNTISSEGR
jgi:hypothetical protein